MNSLLDSPDLLEKDKNFVWHPFTQEKKAQTPLWIKSGKGAYLYTDKGEEIFDAISSWWVTNHGHSHPYIVEKVHEQFKTLEHVIFAGATHEPGVKLAQRLIDLLPPGFQKVFFSDNGSTAVEVALKIAVQYWHNIAQNKKKVIAFQHSYHGDTFGAMSVSARSPFSEPFNSMLFDVIFVPPPLRRQDWRQTCKELEKVCEKHTDIAAFIYEPLVQGAGGMLMQDSLGLQECIKIAKEHKIICIADEVMTGFGRTGKIFASDHLEEKPDIICLAKGLTGGSLPLSTTVCKKWIYDAFYSEDSQKALYHGHSFTGNLLGCAAAHASLDLLEKAECISQIEKIGRFHKQFVEQIQNSKLNEVFSDLRIQGTILACEFKTKESTGYFNHLRNSMTKFFLGQGVLLRPLGNVIYCIPPFCSEEKDLQKVYKSIVLFAEKLRKQHEYA